MASPFHFDRAWQFGVTPTELWSTLARTDCYREWWPWLRGFRVTGDALGEGTRADAVIQAPLPYQLHCTIHVDDAVPDRLLRTHVEGDLEGPASLELSAHDGGAEARLQWALELRAPVLRSFAILARPAMAWAHDRIVERGLVQFEGHALRGRDLLA
jgi:Polyketide cyclase / dehydrase and lipid transport